MMLDHQKNQHQTNDESFKQSMEEEKERTKYRSLQEVYNTIEKWLFIQDRKRIDILLATVLSNKKKGTPIWIFFVGNSGDTKSELINSLEGLKGVIKIDQLTKNTLASGLKNINDLGYDLQHNSKILIFPDLASMTSLHKDEKKIIWGQFRNLFDGFINKRTGSGVNKAYEGCHVTIIAGTTPIIRNEFHIHQQLGTRELLYDTEAEPQHNNEKMNKAWDNESYETQMREEIQNVVYGFVLNHPFREIEISEKIKNFLKNEAERLSLLRATAQTDQRYNELINQVYPEIPTRVVKQFKRLYQVLKSLDDNYPDEKAKKIISHIVNSSGNKIRQQIIEVFKRNEGKAFSIPDLQSILKMGRTALKTQLETLWNLGSLDKEIREERVGGYVNEEYGKEVVRGGRIEKVAYYKAIKRKRGMNE